MSVTIRELYDWIDEGGLPDQTVLTLDGDGTLCADLPEKVAMTYLHVGFIEPENEDDYPDDIEGEPGAIGDIVFWGDEKPRWIIEWQPDNGRVFAIINAEGEVGLAGAEELTRDWRVQNRLRSKETMQLNEPALKFMARLVDAVTQLRHEVGRLTDGGWSAYDYADKFDQLLEEADAFGEEE